MSALQITSLVAYAVGMSIGQLLFKLAADSMSSFGAGMSLNKILILAMNYYFICAIIIYFGLAVFWVWILSFTPLSRAYPFVALALIITPIASHFVFMESLGIQFILGLGFVLIGIILVSG